MSITCNVCGTANPEGTKFCEGCGVELTNLTPVAPATPAASTPSSEMNNEPSSAPGEALSTPSPVGVVPIFSEEFAADPLPTEPEAVTPPERPDAAASTTLPATSASEVSESAVAASSLESGNPTPLPNAAAKLEIKKFGAATGEFIPLQGERLVVGRFDASTGPVDLDLSGLAGQEHISRRHAELYLENGSWHVRDLGSTNGVYLKRKGESAFSPRLQEPAALTDGDELAFGNLMLNFHQG